MNAEYGRVRRIVSTLRMMFVAYGLVWGLAAWVLLASPVGTSGPLRWVPLGLALFAVAGCILGAIDVDKRPFVWAVVVACLQSLNLLVNLISPESTLPRLLIPGFLTAAGWAAVGFAKRLEKLRAEHPELMERSFAGRQLEGGLGLHRVAKQQSLARSRLWLVAGIVAVLLVLLSVVIWISSGPPSLEGPIGRFERSWEAARWEEIAAFELDPRARSAWITRMRERLPGDAAGRLPTLQRGSSEQEGERGLCRWTFSSGTLEARWVYEDSAWIPVSVDFADSAAGSPQVLVGRFADAWATSRKNDVLALMDPTRRRKLGGALERSIEKRAWAEAWPALGPPSLTVEEGRGRASVRFACDGAELLVKFSQRDGQWYLTGFDFPD